MIQYVEYVKCLLVLECTIVFNKTGYCKVHFMTNGSLPNLVRQDGAGCYI